jgi:hypothetical protein
MVTRAGLHTLLGLLVKSRSAKSALRSRAVPMARKSHVMNGKTQTAAQSLSFCDGLLKSRDVSHFADIFRTITQFHLAMRKSDKGVGRCAKGSADLPFKTMKLILPKLV